MEVKALKLEVLLKGGKHQVIPHYQRNYVWDDKLLTGLWESIEEMAAEVLDKPKIADLNNISHYIGALMFTK